MTRMATALVLALVLPFAASAGEKPSFTVQSDGSIVGRMVIDAPAPEVRQAIAVVVNDPRAYTNVLDVRQTPEGDCRRIDRTTRGVFEPLTMHTRWCPTPKGWREYLVQSDDYNAYDVEWTVEARGTQSEVAVRVRSDVNLMVPSSLVRSGTIQGLDEGFSALVKRLLAGRAAR